ncbi:MAG: helix-turn-helix transcriptional regulator, partial [Clostridia bacterium]|nr:helix-turn-helix transcriptional regulator [Clostridia bacterium]
MYSYNSKTYWKIFVCNLIKLRKNNKLSKREMAEICGITVKMLDEIEKGNLPEELSVEII